MKSTPAVVVPSASARTLRAFLSTGLVVAALSALASAQVVDPDPEIFDGSKTKRDTAQVKLDPKSTVDDWEGPNLIVYDSNGEGTGAGGTGSVDGQQPGLDIQVGIPDPLGLPLPIPLAGGGAGGAGDPSANPLQIPVGQQSASNLPQQSANTAGAAQSASRPSAVSIGDPSQRIQTTAQGQAGNVAGEPEGGEEGSQKKGEDSTEIPSAANTSQSGVRGGGVEKGDAMPADL